MKSIAPLLLAALALLATIATLPAQETTYEDFPVLSASAVLKPEWLKGPHHEILDPVPTRGFANQYTVQTDWGTYPVWGNDLLIKRIAEFDAIARLDNASKSDEFKASLRKAAATPLVALGGAIQDPVGAVKGIGQGAARFVQRAGEAIERGGNKSANTDSALQGALGFSKAKREIAAYLNVDPYTDNQILQQRLDDMARANFAGGFVVRASTFALSAGADVGLATAAGRITMTSNVAKMVHDNSPLDLSKMNRTALVALGVSERGAEAFVEHPHISPTQQTMMTSHLGRLGPVPGIEDFLAMSLASQSSVDGQFFVQCAEMMADYHENVSPIKRVLNLHGLPTIHATNNALVLPMAIDYVSWSPEADRLSQAVAAYNPQVEISQRTLFLSGRVSPLAERELKARGFIVISNRDQRAYLPETP